MSTRTMWDALYPNKIPTGIDPTIVIASYIDNHNNPDSHAQAVARFPDHDHVTISSNGDPVAMILDVEPDAEEPTDRNGIIGWVNAKHAQGRIATIYANDSTWPTVLGYLNAAGTTAYRWQALWDGNAVVNAGTIGHQFTGSQAATPPGAYDQSVVDADWLSHVLTQVAPPAPPVPPAGGGTYTVVAGDTLSGIADRNGTTWQTLQALNHISNPNLIYPGQVIVLPHGGAPAPAPAPSHPTYTVQPGDSLIGIAAKYPDPAITWASIAAINGITNPNLIHPGQVLAIG